MSWSNPWPGGSEPVPPSLAPHQAQAVEWIDQRLSRYSGVILADETGLGKSWVAATVLRERLRGGATAELIIPASLQSMWREVCDQFALSVPIVTHDVVRRSSSSGAGMSFIVVDEAHRFRNPTTRGWDRLGRRLVGARALFLTATPIWNSPDDLLALLRLLVRDDALKSSGVASIEEGLSSPIGRSRILDRLVLRRDSAVVPGPLGFGPLHGRMIIYDIPSGWTDLLSRIETLRFPHCAGYSETILTQLMIRRLHSSPSALRATLERQLRFCRSGLDLLRDGYRLHRHEFTRFLLVEDGVQELLFPQLFLDPEDEPDAGALQREIEIIESILRLLEHADSPKREHLMNELSQTAAPSLIFVGAVDTAKELFASLSMMSRCGVATGAHCRYRGGNSIGELTAAFQEGRLDHLILTDLGGEGLNLQRADRVIHYDLPWSPMRLEQRNGRARRIGREGRPLEVVTFAPGEGELPTLKVIDRKRRTNDAFWSPAVQDVPTDRSLERLPSRITAGQPQSDLWKALPETAKGEWLLRRYRSGVEQMMREADSPGEIEELRRLVEREG